MLKKTTLFIIVCLYSCLLINNPAFARPAKDDIYKQIELFSDVITAIQHDYVEVVKPKDIIFRYYMKPIVERSLNKGNRKSNPPQ